MSMNTTLLCRTDRRGGCILVKLLGDHEGGEAPHNQAKTQMSDADGSKSEVGGTIAARPSPSRDLIEDR